MAPTKDELEQENEQLRARVAELEDQAAAAPAAAARRTPQQPDFGLSAGEMNDLKTAGVTISPFTGKLLNALDEGIAEDELTPEALAAAKRERAARPPASSSETSTFNETSRLAGE